MTMLSNMMDQFCRDLHERQFVNSPAINDPTSNINSNNHSLVLAVLCAALFPNIAQVSVGRSSKRNLPRNSTSFRVKTAEDGDVVIHPRSVNYDAQFTKSTWLCYYDKVKSTSIYLHDCSVVSPFAVLFFGGEQLFKRKDGKIFSGLICDSSSTRERIETLRTCWENYLCHRVSHPGLTDWSAESTDSALLHAIILFTTSTTLSFREQISRTEMTRNPRLSDYGNLVLAPEHLITSLSLSSTLD